MSDIEIKRGYEVLPNNNIRFGIRITNISELAIFDVEIILDFPESLFKLEGERLQKIGVIPSASARTAEFILKPLGCVHKINIEALITYRDAKSKKYRIDMHPKEVHCVCPFLKGKKMSRSEFLELSVSGHSAEMGLNFKGVTVERLTSFLVQTCKSRHYKVDDFSIDSGKMLYLASESIGEKAYYLLTALIKEEDDLTQVMLRAVSDKPHGLNGFLNETVADLRHVVETVQSAREIGVIKKGQVINIIDSVVQRTTFAGEEGGASVNIKDRVVQRAEFKGDQERKSREEKDRKAREDRERKAEAESKDRENQDAMQKEDRQKRQREEVARKQRENDEERNRVGREAKTFGGKWFVGLIIILAVLALVWYGTQDSSNPATPQKTIPSVNTTPVMTAKATPYAAAVVTSSADQKTITNSIGMEFVQIPSGEFDMGSPANETGRQDNEGPVHHVKISNAFYMGKYEVTQKQWQEVMGSNPSYFKGDNLPVEKVSRNDVQDFIKKLNEKEGINRYRLPSEAEWEYASRAGTTTKYSFGDNESNIGEYAWYDSNSGGKTHEVGQKKPNPWGLYDMQGNVLELVQDIYHDSYIGAPTDGSSWQGDDPGRVIRGGAWDDYRSDDLRSATRERDGLHPGALANTLGFRLLMEIDIAIQNPKVTQTAPPATIITPSADQNTITNSIGMEFVLIPAGEFDMGSPSNEKDRDIDEGPVHHVKISNSFYMGKYEVTQKQWQEVMGSNPSYFKGDDLPVESVLWNEVQDFIKKLNDKEGVNKYRLPSEAEWEYAARAGTTTKYSFGDDESNLGDYAWYNEKTGPLTHDVGLKKPNPWGLYDMHGNVVEWVSDKGHGNYNGAPTDGSSWDSGVNPYRVIRGGSFFCEAGTCRSAKRAFDIPENRAYTHGFRLLRIS